MTMLGYKLGTVPIIRRNFDVAILSVIVLSLLPPVLEALRTRRTSQVRQ